MIRFSRVVALLLAAVPSVAAATPATTAEGKIIFLGTGWVSANTRVQLDIPLLNPDSCPTTDGYIVNPADSGSELFSATLLSAYMANRRVSLVVDGCTIGRPRIIGVNVLPN